MTEAADKLHISQPALSMMLKKLEEELGVVLFDRTKNKIILNAAGELALKHTNEILLKADEMKSIMTDYIQKDFLFKVGFCDPGPLWYCTPSFSITFPDYEMRSKLYADNLDETDLLLNQTYDVLITDRMILHPDIICAPFLEDKMILSISEKHPLASNDTISLKNIDDLSIAIFYVGGRYFTKQEPFYRKLSEHLKITLYEDYFIFQQKVKNTNLPTFTTELVKRSEERRVGKEC